MAFTGWNKVQEKDGDEYYHNKFTGEMCFTPPTETVDNEPLRRKMTLPRFTRVIDSQGKTIRSYSIGDDIYVTASQSENTKYVHLGRYIKSKANPEATTERIILSDIVWEELCRKKNLVSELAMSYGTISGARQLSGPTYHEKCRMLLGDQIYVSLHVKDDITLDLRYFDHVWQTVSDDNGNFIRQWTVIPSKRGISLKLNQWSKLTDVAGFTAVDHLKALSNVKRITKKQQELKLATMLRSLHKKRRNGVAQKQQDMKPVVTPRVNIIKCRRKKQQDMKPIVIDTHAMQPDVTP